LRANHILKVIFEIDRYVLIKSTNNDYIYN